MKKVLVFGASNSRNSINKKLAIYAANRLTNLELIIADLNDYELPVYSVDLEAELGVHENASKFHHLIKQCDAFVVSLAEYNGLHTAAFKNLWDWMSRLPLEKPMQIWGEKPMFLLSTSPSKRLESNVLKVSKQLFPFFGAKIVADYHLPSFNHFFKDEEIVDSEQRKLFDNQSNTFQEYINNLSRL